MKLEEDKLYRCCSCRKIRKGKDMVDEDCASCWCGLEQEGKIEEYQFMDKQK